MAPTYPEVLTRTRNPIRRLVHLTLAILGWVLFVVFWYLVFIKQIDSQAVVTFLLLFVAFVGIGFINLIWVHFNLAIHRRYGSRVSVRSVPFRARHDACGRVYRTPGWSTLGRARTILIDVDDRNGLKTFVAGLEETDGSPRGQSR